MRFIVAEAPVLQRLGILYRERLEQSYEREYYRRRAAEAIIKELTPKLASLRNAELAENLNVCVLLLQYENSLAVHYQEFSDHRKEATLREILTSEGFSLAEAPAPVGGSAVSPTSGAAASPGPAPIAPAEPPGPAIPDPKMPAYEKRRAPELPPAARPNPGRTVDAPPIASGRRAVETEEYRTIQNMEPKGRWEKAVGVYGVQFLLRIHFRKCEFNIVTALVRAGKIGERKDLEYIRDTLTMMLANLQRDPCLAAHVEHMHALRDLVDMRLAAD